MNLDTKDWKEFVLEKLFTIKKGKRLTAEDQEDGNNNYIGAIDSNNGIANHIAQLPIHQENTISLSYNGSVGEAFYQKDPYWATDDVNALYSKYDGFNEPIGLFLTTVLRQEKYKFSYGRKWTLDNMNRTIIKLPVKHNECGTPFIDTLKKYSDEGYVPDWEWMESCIKSLHHKPLTTQNKSELVSNLDVEKWKEFVLGDYFDVFLSSGDLKIDDYESGNIPLISSGSTNNGIVGYIDKAGDGKAQMFKAGSITVDMFCNAFYQSEDFYAVSHGRVNILRPKFECNLYVGLFVCNIINQEQFKYSYGRAVYSSEISRMIIKLPVNAKGDPDWQWMENYIKSLPYGDRI